MVDHDIDVADLNDIVWAMCTRCNPADSIDILRRTWSGPLDPIIPRDQKGHNSRAIIDACPPLRMDQGLPARVGREPGAEGGGAGEVWGVFEGVRGVRGLRLQNRNGILFCREPHTSSVIPAQAGIHGWWWGATAASPPHPSWIPAPDRGRG